MKIIVRNLQARPILDPRRLLRVVEVARDHAGGVDGRVGFAFLDDELMAEHHRRFLGQSRTTDVLSFPDQPGGAGHESEPGVEAEPYWGDVIICTEQARRQALDLGHPYGYELVVLALHGSLHLLGYDHTRDGGRMKRLEERLRPLCVAGGEQT